MQRRGLALIWVLACLVVLSVATTALLALVRSQRTEHHLARQEEREVALLRDAEDLVAAWLAVDGADLVLPPDGTALVVLDDRLPSTDGEPAVRVCATIYDGLGGLPAHLVGGRGPLAGSKPTGFTDLDLPAVPAGAPVRPADLLERVSLVGNRLRFPDPLPGHTVGPAGLGRLSLAEWLKPHSDGRVNVNTTPLALLAPLVAGIEGVEPDDVRGQRAAGRRVTLARGDLRSRRGFTLVDTTDCWAAAIGVRCGRRERSWWVVFAASGDGVSRIQRHAF